MSIIKLVQSKTKIMQNNDIEKLAYEACFSTDYSVKSNGQQYFYALAQQVNMQQLDDLINNYSPTVVFLVMEYMHKVIMSHQQPKNVFLTINNSVMVWFTNTASLVRKDQKALEVYIEKSVGRTLGECLKVIYLKSQNRQWVRKTISQLQNPRYKLYLWINLIDAVSTIDRTISFMDYRSMVYSFQQLMVPNLMDNLLPFFQSVKQQIQINQLSSNIQSTLSLQSTSTNFPHTILLFTKSQQKFTQLVFNLLKQIICFNYNITYSQYQSETVIDNCLISYPDAITRKIVARDFISSIFYVVQRLAREERVNNFSGERELVLEKKKSVDSMSVNQKFMNITLQCLTKIALIKLTYVNQRIKEQFVKEMVIGINRLFTLLQKLSSQDIILLIQLNTKLLINIQLYEIRKMQAQFMQWIQKISQAIIMVLKTTQISIENCLLIDCLELTNKIVGQSVSSHLKQQHFKFKKFGLEIYQIFIQSFFSMNHQLLGSNISTKLNNFDDIKKNTLIIFRKIKHMITLDLTTTLPMLENSIMQVLNRNPPQINTIANVFFMVGDLCQLGIFDRNILYEDTQPAMYPVFGKIVNILLQWVIYYRGTGQVVEIIEVAILLFIQKLVSEILTQFNYQQKNLILKTTLFTLIKQNQKNLNSDQDFLVFCFQQFAKSLSNGGYARVSYTFDIMGILLLKFKWGLRRQSFKETALAKTILELCVNLSGSNFEGQLLKLRKKLFKIITNISFDDILDDYHENIDKLVDSLVVTMHQNIWKALYDLIGICQAIDIPTIYRYFITKLSKKVPIPEIMNQFFMQAGDNMQIILQILNLQFSMVNNKYHKLNGVKATRINYMLFQSMLNFWILLFNKAITDSWQEHLSVLYQIVITMINGKHVNFYLLQRICGNYSEFMKSVLRNMVAVSSWIFLYPGLYMEYGKLMQEISSQLLPIILCSKDQELIVDFNNVFDKCLTLTSTQLQQIKSIDQVSQPTQLLLNSSLQAIDNIFKYLRDSKKLIHKQTQIRNIEMGILKINFTIKFQFLVSVFIFGIDLKKNKTKYLDNICCIIHHMDFISFQAFQPLNQRIGLSQQRIGMLRDIWGLVDTNMLEDDEEKDKQFLVRIKNWFKQCDNDTMLEPDY